MLQRAIDPVFWLLTLLSAPADPHILCSTAFCTGEKRKKALQKCQKGITSEGNSNPLMSIHPCLSRTQGGCGKKDEREHFHDNPNRGDQGT